MSGETIYPMGERKVPRQEPSRKSFPVARGVLDYFPDAILAVAEVSRAGSVQHHPYEPMHWDRNKSMDQADALARHLIDRGKLDTDGLRHTAKVAWRALALLQTELEHAKIAGEALHEIAEAMCMAPKRAGFDPFDPH